MFGKFTLNITDTKKTEIDTMNKRVIGAALLAVLLTAGTYGIASAADKAATEANGCGKEGNGCDHKEASKDKEKCYGVAKAGKNDCASKDGSNSCSGQSTKDADPNSWLHLPAGVCDKLAGGVKG